MLHLLTSPTYRHSIGRHAGSGVRDSGERRVHQSLHVSRRVLFWLYEWSHGLWNLQISGQQLWLVDILLGKAQG